MADPISLPETDDGQSIPAALAAPTAPKKPRPKAAKPVEQAPVTVKAPKAPRIAKPVVPSVAAEPMVEAEPVVRAVAPEPEPELEPAPVGEAAPEPVIEASAPEPEPVTAPAVAPLTPTPTAAVTAEPRKESIMATTIDNVTNATAANTAKAQAFFADANERAKGAVAKGQKFFADATEFNKGNVEALVESSKIAAKAFETMGQDAAEYGRKSFEEASAAFKTLATVKSPTEFMKLHSDYVRASFDSFVAETSRSTEQALKLAGEVAQPISNRLSLAAEKIKTAA